MDGWATLLVTACRDGQPGKRGGVRGQRTTDQGGIALCNALDVRRDLLADPAILEADPLLVVVALGLDEATEKGSEF